jgi:hypothetical protein
MGAYADYIHEQSESMEWLLTGKHDPASTTFCACVFDHPQLIDETTFPRSRVALGRCIEVLEQVMETPATHPSVRCRLEVLCDLGDAWASLFEHWETLVDLFRQAPAHAEDVMLALQAIEAGQAPVSRPVFPDSSCDTLVSISLPTPSRSPFRGLS